MAYPMRNRPLHRYLARIYCRLRYGAGRTHFEEWWPGLRLQMPGSDGSAGCIEYKGQALVPLHSFPVLARLDELVIVGSGPSLAGQATGKIPMSSAILLNGAIHLMGEGDRQPFAIVIEDERFIWRHWRDLRRLVSEPADVYLSTGVIRSLCEVAPDWLAKQRVRHIDFIHKPYLAPRPDVGQIKELPFLAWSDDAEFAISLRPGSGIVPAGSVAVTAAQIALAMRPRKIGLAGIDLTSTQTPRFYEEAGDQAMSRLDAAVGKILKMFDLIRQEAVHLGIAVENYSPVSLLASVGYPFLGRLDR